jgi:hypothetical protein
MKRVCFVFWFVLLSGTSGCFGWGDYMKFPPASSSPEIWFKKGVSETEKSVDRRECKDSVESSLPPLVAGDYSYADKARHIVEYCMLAKGYMFTDVIVPGGVSYCSRTYYGSGPACKSIGR